MEKIKIRLTALDEFSKALIQTNGYSTTLDIVLSCKKTWRTILSHLEGKWNKIVGLQNLLQLFFLNSTEGRFSSNMMETSNLVERIGTTFSNCGAIAIVNEATSDFVTYQCFYSIANQFSDSNSVLESKSEVNNFNTAENTMDCFASLRDYANKMDEFAPSLPKNAQNVTENISESNMMTKDSNNALHIESQLTTSLTVISSDSYSILNELANGDNKVNNADIDYCEVNSMKSIIAPNIVDGKSHISAIAGVTEHKMSGSATLVERKRKKKKMRVSFKEQELPSAKESKTTSLPVEMIAPITEAVQKTLCNTVQLTAPIALLKERSTFPSAFYTSKGYISTHIKNNHLLNGNRKKRRITPYYVGPLSSELSPTTCLT